VGAPQRQILIDYLDNGGRLYIEGSDFGFNHCSTTFFSYFGCNYDANVTANISTMYGVSGTFTGDMEFAFVTDTDANYSVDAISASTGTDIFTSAGAYNRAVAHESRQYKTICSTPSLGGFVNNNDYTRAILMGQYLAYLTGSATGTSELNIVSAPAELGNNFPNPFNPSGAGRSPSTTISFNLTTSLRQGSAGQAGNTENTELVIYNLKGQKVKTLVDEILPSGEYSVTWNGTNRDNQPVSSGIYLYKLQMGTYSSTKKMILLR
jgi:hypothetical protein